MKVLLYMSLCLTVKIPFEGHLLFWCKTTRIVEWKIQVLILTNQNTITKNSRLPFYHTDYSSTLFGFSMCVNIFCSNVRFSACIIIRLNNRATVTQSFLRMCIRKIENHESHFFFLGHAIWEMFGFLFHYIKQEEWAGSHPHQIKIVETYKKILNIW